MKRNSIILSLALALVMTFGMIAIVPLTANAAEADRGAEIGGGYNGGGTVTINGGIVTATGADERGAGIGGGCNGGGTVAINGGTVTATGTDNGAGVGCEYNGPGSFSP